jgi:hypothetical protein
MAVDSKLRVAFLNTGAQKIPEYKINTVVQEFVGIEDILPVVERAVPTFTSMVDVYFLFRIILHGVHRDSFLDQYVVPCKQGRIHI